VLSLVPTFFYPKIKSKSINLLPKFTTQQMPDSLLNEYSLHSTLLHIQMQPSKNSLSLRTQLLPKALEMPNATFESTAMMPGTTRYLSCVHIPHLYGQPPTSSIFKTDTSEPIRFMSSLSHLIPLTTEFLILPRLPLFLLKATLKKFLKLGQSNNMMNSLIFKKCL
jgi:hypothetical protein